MNRKSNQVLLGIILLLAGILTLFQNIFNINYGNLGMLICGLALMLLYFTKRTTWSLILGTYFSYAGLLSIEILGFSLRGIASAGMFFIVPGIIFLVLFYHKNRRGLLIPGCVLLWFGIFTVIKHILPMSSGTLLLICIGIAFLMAYNLEKGFIGKWALYLGTGLLVMGVFKMFKIPFVSRLIGVIPYVGSAALIIISICIIFLALRKKQ